MSPITIGSLAMVFIFASMANGSVHRDAPTDDSPPTSYDSSTPVDDSQWVYYTPSDNETPTSYYETPPKSSWKHKSKGHSKKKKKETPWNETPADDTPQEDQNPWVESTPSPPPPTDDSSSTPWVESTPSPPPPTESTPTPSPSPPPPTDNSTPTSGNSDIDSWLIPHNEARLAVGLTPLVWKSYLADYAQNWVNSQRQNCDMIHSNGPYGENIFWGSGSGFTANDGVMNWVNERDHYDEPSDTCWEGDCGHYTQIVWRGTTSVGCGMVVCDNDKGTFMCCDYDPPGNVIGQKPY